jgi:hypothetical protein
MANLHQMSRQQSEISHPSSTAPSCRRIGQHWPQHSAASSAHLINDHLHIKSGSLFCPHSSTRFGMVLLWRCGCRLLLCSYLGTHWWQRNPSWLQPVGRRCKEIVHYSLFYWWLHPKHCLIEAVRCRSVSSRSQKPEGGQHLDVHRNGIRLPF